MDCPIPIHDSRRRVLGDSVSVHISGRPGVVLLERCPALHVTKQLHGSQVPRSLPVRSFVVIGEALVGPHLAPAPVVPYEVTWIRVLPAQARINEIRRHRRVGTVRSRHHHAAPLHQLPQHPLNLHQRIPKYPLVGRDNTANILRVHDGPHVVLDPKSEPSDEGRDSAYGPHVQGPCHFERMAEGEDGRGTPVLVVDAPSVPAGRIEAEPRP
mmetsp:Transcript_48577/g.94957  ORF Transcript_48577/g.94957 Transcript_48577/m.94957 type:complete len:212 (+) Transcript_48577:201-836(+)